MSQGAVFIGWNRPVAGREQQAIETFSSLMNVLTQAQKDGHISGFEPVGLEAHGGDLNGFCLIKGDQTKVWNFIQGEQFQDVWFNALYSVQNLGITQAYTGEHMQNRMSRFSKLAAQSARANTK